MDRLTQAAGVFASANAKKLQIMPSFEAADGAVSRVFPQQPIAKTARQ
jgi:hypothetical protein